MTELDVIHSKVAYQDISYFRRRNNWRGWNSAEMSITWGLIAIFVDDTGNHGISGIQSTPSKTGLIDNSLFVLGKILVRVEFGG